jgi:SAM-dependent methyltransferase
MRLFQNMSRNQATGSPASQLCLRIACCTLVVLLATWGSPISTATEPDPGAPPSAAIAEDAAASQSPAEAELAEEKLPRPLKRYKGRRIAPYMTWHGAVWLTRPERAQEEQTDKLLAALKIKPGQTVCDLGCGNGYYTLELARMVGPKGKVLAVDIQPEMLHLLDLRVKEAGLANVEPIPSTPIDPRLPPASCDLILAEDPLVPIKPEHKMSKRQVLKELEPNGYELAEQYDDLSWQHVLFFRRAEKGEEDSVKPAKEASSR